ncbi:MAG TPA: SDR family oxidoreductase [Acidimicrobiales bacterium]|nr:SDR family oxidoreductase [Acidimicrobiales bacterium]
MATNLRDKVALVTGSSSGIGEATARALAAEGVRVVVNSAHSVDAGQVLAADLPGATYVQADVSDADQAAALVSQAVADHGRLDILVNNAGTTALIAHHDIEAATPEIWRRIFDVNVIGTWQVTTAAIPHLRAAGDAAVVNISSIAGHAATGSSIPYAASKAALSHMTVLLANVLGPEIRVNAVAPGLIDTPWTEDWDLVRAGVQAMAPLRRTGRPEDIAQMVVAVADARYMTGEVVLVDGGLHLFR